VSGVNGTFEGESPSDGIADSRGNENRPAGPGGVVGDSASGIARRMTGKVAIHTPRGGSQGRPPFALMTRHSHRPVRNNMFVTVDPLEQLRQTYTKEVELLDRALATLRKRFAYLDELIAEEQSRGAMPALVRRAQ
jgi:hypothetical protein